MAKKTATILGAIFMVLGIFGFLFPNPFGTHLSPSHNIIHFVSGAAAVYCGLASERLARLFCLAFGALYFLLGVGGFAFGKPSAPTVPITAPQPGEDQHLWRLLPGTLELGDQDHALHMVVGIIFVMSGLSSSGRKARAVTVDRSHQDTPKAA